MSIFRTLFQRFARALIFCAALRRPDFIVGNPVTGIYLCRWWLIPRNPIFNVYLHQFCRSDDDRALHDHPWAWCSILLDGEYVEHTITAGGIHRRRLRTAGSVKFSPGGRAHRVELLNHTSPLASPSLRTTKRIAYTLFITGPRYREWGFHHPEAGWIHHSEWDAFIALYGQEQAAKSAGP